MEREANFQFHNEHEEGGKFSRKASKCWQCKKWPKVLVNASAWPLADGIGFNAMSLFYTYSKIGTCLKSAWCNLLVVFWLFVTTMVAALCSCVGVGDESSNPKCFITDRMCFAYLAASQAANSSLSVELRATSCCNFHLHVMGPCEKDWWSADRTACVHIISPICIGEGHMFKMRCKR